MASMSTTESIYIFFKKKRKKKMCLIVNMTFSGPTIILSDFLYM